MSETLPSDAPYDHKIPSEARLRAQRRQIELYGGPAGKPDAPPEEIEEGERIRHALSEETRQALDAAFAEGHAEFRFGRRLREERRADVEAALARYVAELESGAAASPGTRLMQIAMLRRILRGEAIGEWNRREIAEEALADERAAEYTLEDMEEAFEFSYDIYAEDRDWIEIAYPEKGDEEAAEDLA